MIERVRVVLVGTSHPGNIGSAARAMKTMGLEALYLVSPAQFPHPKAIELAANAGDVLNNAIVVQTFHEAIADCSLVIGTSARARTIPWPLFNPREMADKVMQEPPNGQIAIVFGREQSGLTNEELQQCHLHVQIPTHSEFSSLNIAAAVQVIAYELRMASLTDDRVMDHKWDYRLANVSEMELFFTHLQEIFIEIDFLKMSAPRKLMTRMRRLFLRARPDIMEINMLRGMLTAIQESKNKE